MVLCRQRARVRACSRVRFPKNVFFFFYRLALWHVRVALFLLSTKRSPCMIRVCIEGVSCCPRHPEGGGPWARNRPFWCMFVCTQIDALSSTGLRAPPPNTHTHSTHPPFWIFSALDKLENLSRVTAAHNHPKIPKTCMLALSGDSGPV